MGNDYVTCFITYEGNREYLEDDREALADLASIDAELEDMRWEGEARNIEYSDLLEHDDRVQTIPSSFELRKDLLEDGSIETELVYFLERSERWNWRTENDPKLEGEHVYESEDAVVMTAHDAMTERLNESERVDRVS